MRVALLKQPSILAYNLWPSFEFHDRIRIEIWNRFFVEGGGPENLRKTLKAQVEKTNEQLYSYMPAISTNIEQILSRKKSYTQPVMAQTKHKFVNCFHTWYSTDMVTARRCPCCKLFIVIQELLYYHRFCHLALIC